MQYFSYFAVHLQLHTCQAYLVVIEKQEVDINNLQHIILYYFTFAIQIITNPTDITAGTFWLWVKEQTLNFIGKEIVTWHLSYK